MLTYFLSKFLGFWIYCHFPVHRLRKITGSPGKIKQKNYIGDGMFVIIVILQFLQCHTRQHFSRSKTLKESCFSKL